MEATLATAFIGLTRRHWWVVCVGVLAGIVFIGSVGEFVMRSARGSRDSKGFILAGLALFVIGYVGLIFARLIKAAVSREREFLADASSVQFTRNPDGTWYRGQHSSNPPGLEEL